MHSLAFALQSSSWTGWIAGHWIGIVVGIALVGMIYFVAALALNLPLPFEERKKE